MLWSSMANKKKRTSRSRSKRNLTEAKEKTWCAALFLLLLLPIIFMSPLRIWREANPQGWEQTRIIYADHVRRSAKSSDIYVMHDTDGRPWRMPDEDAFDLEQFASEVQPGDELTIHYYRTNSMYMVKSIEGYFDYEDAAQRSLIIAKTDSYVFAAALAVSGMLVWYIVYQLNKIHHFLPRRRK